MSFFFARKNYTTLSNDSGNLQSQYCDCRLPESFDSVVACDGCDNWKCVDFNTNHVL